MKKTMNRMLALALILMSVLTVISAPGRADANQGCITIAAPTSDLFFGDTVTLTSSVSDVDAPYSITWEADFGQGWKAVNTGSTYSFELTEQTAAASYRAVLTVEAE